MAYEIKKIDGKRIKIEYNTFTTHKINYKSYEIILSGNRYVINKNIFFTLYIDNIGIKLENYSALTFKEQLDKIIDIYEYDSHLLN